MTYQWKDTTFVKADAQTAGEIFERLENTQGGLTPHRLVDISRPEDAPLHGEFEWRDDVAAEKFRETQASYLIRHLCIAPTSEEQAPVRAYFTLSARSIYENTQVINATIEKRTALLSIAMRELRSFQMKYQTLSELDSVLSAIDNVLNE